ncbi:hypothetical protein BH20ACI3_BH20ACI3_15820 [soil metagenome]
MLWKVSGRRGQKPETFDFLGFTHYCGQTGDGRVKVKRKTAKKKYRAKLKEVKGWLQRERSHLKERRTLASGQTETGRASELLRHHGQLGNVQRVQNRGDAAFVPLAEPAKSETELRLGAVQ